MFNSQNTLHLYAFDDVGDGRMMKPGMYFGERDDELYAMTDRKVTIVNRRCSSFVSVA